MWARIIVLTPNIPPRSQEQQPNTHDKVKGIEALPQWVVVGVFRTSWSQCPVRLQPEDWRGTLILHVHTHIHTLFETKTHNHQDRKTHTHKPIQSRDYTPYPLTSLWSPCPDRTQTIMISLPAGLHSDVLPVHSLYRPAVAPRSRHSVE